MKGKKECVLSTTEITHPIQWRYDSKELCIAHTGTSVCIVKWPNTNPSLIVKGHYVRNVNTTCF